MKNPVLTNYPKILSLKDYEDAISKFVSDNRDSSKAIFLAGNLHHPGISDLDFIIVGSKPIIDDTIKEFLVDGNVIAMPEDLIEYINYFDKFPLKQLSGSKIAVKNNSYKDFNLIQIMEWLPERILLLQDLMNGKTYDIRKLLMVLKSINISIIDVEDYLNLSVERPDINYVMGNFLNIDLQLLSKRFLSAAIEAWSKFESNIQLFEGDITGNVQFSRYYKFSNKFPLLLQYLKYISSLHNSFSIQTREFMSLSGSNKCISESLEQFIDFRVNLLSRLYNWFIQNNFKTGMVKYGWILNK